MKRVTLSLAIFFAIGFTSASADIIHIPGDYPTIQEGIDASTDGDTVLVHPGMYVENINFNGHNIVLGSLFLTTGDSTYIPQTIIDGDSSGTVVVFHNAEDSTAVITGFTIQNGYFEYGGGISCRFWSSPTISHNIIRDNSADAGGGIYDYSDSVKIIGNTIMGNSAATHSGGICDEGFFTIIRNNTIIDNSSGSSGGGGIGGCRYWGSRIIDNIICNNSTEGRGGGIYFTANDVIVSGNLISGNSAGDGGGIFCYHGGGIICDNVISGNSTFGQRGGGGIYHYFAGSIAIVDNIISDNHSDYFGGGIFCYANSGGNISGNIIVRNTADYSGGGIRCEYYTPNITNNVITGNSAYSLGGGISCCYETSPFIGNNVIFENSAYWGGGLSVAEYSSPLVVNTVFWADSASERTEIHLDGTSSPNIFYCDVQGGWEGIGNIDVDPRFRDPENGDFHLMADSCGDVYNSPCIDAGDPAIFDSALGCDWGLGLERSDMGAYGGQAIPTDIREEHPPTIPMACGLLQNYPNPFNATTTLSYMLPQSGPVSVAIYNLLGQRVATIFEGEKQAGRHTITWDGAGFPSGVYFARLEAGEYSESIKMVLLK